MRELGNPKKHHFKEKLHLRTLQKMQEPYIKNFVCIQIVSCFWSSAFNQELQNGHISEDSLG